ncbi:unnamed protein product, partial [Polarella glacialis]
LHAVRPSLAAPAEEEEEAALPLGAPSGDVGVELLQAMVVTALRRCVPPGTERVGLLFSGGLDSGLLAWLCSRGDLGASCSVTCYTVGFHFGERKLPEDLAAAEAAARCLGVEWRQHAVDLQET